MFDNLIGKVKGYFTSNTNESSQNENMNQEVENSSVAQEKPEALENEKPIEPMQNNEQQDNNVEKSQNEVQQGGKSKKKKKSLKLKKKKTARKTKSKKNKTKDRKHGSGASASRQSSKSKEQQWKPKSGDLGIQKYYGQYVTVEGLNGNKNVGKLIKMDGLGDEPRGILIKNDTEGTIYIANIKKVTVTHPDNSIGEI